jgi:hypothetical protein
MALVHTGTLEIWQHGVRIVNVQTYADDSVAKDAPIEFNVNEFGGIVHTSINYKDSAGKDRMVGASVFNSGIVRFSRV